MKKKAPKGAQAAPATTALAAADSKVLSKVCTEIEAVFKKYGVVGAAAFATKEMTSVARVLRLAAPWTSLEVAEDGTNECPRKNPTKEQDMQTMQLSANLVSALELTTTHIQRRTLQTGFRVMLASGAPKPLVEALQAAGSFLEQKVQVTKKATAKKTAKPASKK